MVDCSYVNIGCENKIKRKNMDFHLKDFTQTHMVMMLKQIEDTNSELSFLRQELDIKNKELELYEVKMASLETRFKDASL
ncbi:TNF receptor-associated factor 6-like [Clytia hemisphaerica]